MTSREGPRDVLGFSEGGHGTRCERSRPTIVPKRGGDRISKEVLVDGRLDAAQALSQESSTIGI